MQFKQLADEASSYLDKSKVDFLSQVYVFAKQAHKNQKRFSGQPYISHPIAVAYILAHIRMDVDSIAAALLHDVLEDTAITMTDMENKFGSVITSLVDGVSKLTKISFGSKAEQQAESFRKMLLAMSKDIRVLIIKLADRLHNMRTIHVLPSARQKRIARETLEIYAPLASRLGINDFKLELEELGFQTAYPLRAKIIRKYLEKKKAHHNEIMTLIHKALSRFLSVELSAGAFDIVSRKKNFYGIYKKMQRKRLPLAEITDFYGFRIIVKKKEDCYRVLGIVHSVYKPLLAKFKDYIALPKPNGYQSLHTTLLGPYGVPIEIQIRTQEMDLVNEYGIAAHWLYKNPDASVSEAKIRTKQWLSGLVDIQNTTENPLDFIHDVKLDLFSEEVYVFTPKEKIINLPKGACAIDFAYAIHTDIGNACIAVKIDRKLSPLRTALDNGQTIEIITAQGAHPNPAWLDFVVSGKARTNIRSYLRNQQRKEGISLGKRLLAAAFNKKSTALQFDKDIKIANYLMEHQYNSIDDFYLELGQGKRNPVLVAKQLIDEAVLSKSNQLMADRQLLVNGTEGMMLHFSRCCWPLPGDPIVGYLSQGAGLYVHCESCSKVAKVLGDQNKCITLSWAKEIKEDFKVGLYIDVLNKRGMLAKIANAIFEAKANIDMIKANDEDREFSKVYLVLEVINRNHLADVMKQLRKMKAVRRIVRHAEIS